MVDLEAVERVILTITQEATGEAWPTHYDSLYICDNYYTTDAHWVGECVFGVYGERDLERRVVIPLAWLDLNDSELIQHLQELKAESEARDTRIAPMWKDALTYTCSENRLNGSIENLRKVLTTIDPSWLQPFALSEIEKRLNSLQSLANDCDTKSQALRDQINAVLPVVTEQTLDEACIFPSEVCEHPYRSYDEWS